MRSTAPKGIGEGNAIDDAFSVALRHHQAGHAEQAAAIYEDVLRQNPDHDSAWHLLGVVHQQRGSLERASECIGRAIALNGHKAIYYNNLGVVLRAQRRLSEAEAAYGQALSINPRYADALSNLGVALHEQARFQEAVAAFEQALRTQPAHADALYNLGNLYRDLGRTDEAIRLYRETLKVHPRRAEAYNNLGSALLAERRIAEAVDSYRQAIALQPGCAEAHLNLGAAYAEQDLIEEAAQCYATASAMRPDKLLWKMKSASLCPTIFQDAGELERYRERLEADLDAYREVPLEGDWRDVPTNGFIPSFNLSHHGRNNRPLKEKFAALFQRRFPERRARVRGGRPRIGFVVTRHHEGGFLRGTGGIIEHLDHSRFEVVVLCSESVLGTCQGSIRRAEVQWIGFPDPFPLAVQRIAAAQCDLLYHWQIGTDPLNYFLPFAGLAPVQCTGWGTHATTGIAAVDYYLSSRLMEAEGAEEHYTEKLHCFSTFPTYQRRIPQPPPTDRAYFGLPDDGHLYLCPHRLAKFHPDFDPLLRGVLEGDEHGFVAILQGKHERPAAMLRKRFERTLGGVANRVVFLPSQKPEDYYRLLSLAEVLLDTLHYSAGLVGHDAFSLNVPIVTLPGKFNVGRYTLGYYRRMGVEELIARSPEEYVALAVRLGTDRDYRQAVRARIAERSHVLFEDIEAVREHERFFERALDEAKKASDGAIAARRGVEHE